MKIGILTYFWDINPGTFLQAYSTYRAIKTSFPTDRVEIINVKLGNTYFKPAKSHLFSPDKILKAFIRFNNYKNELEKLDFSQGSSVGKNTVKALEYINKQSYDVIFVGSDTVFKMHSWNIKSDSLPVYYLDGIKAKKIIMAASCCSTSIGDFSPRMKEIAYICLNDFYKIGVRDKNTFDLFHELKGNSINLEIIPDPTFTFMLNTKKAYEVLVKNKFNFESKSVILNLPNDFPALKNTIRYFKERKWNIVTFDYTRYADYCLFVNPDEWAGIPYFVDLVITDRFHGSIFSIRNNTPVIGIDCNPIRISSFNNSSKIKALFDVCEISSNYINFLDKPSDNQYFDVINYAINNKKDFTGINIEMRNRYTNFIQNVAYNIKKEEK